MIYDKNNDDIDIILNIIKRLGIIKKISNIKKYETNNVLGSRKSCKIYFIELFKRIKSILDP